MRSNEVSIQLNVIVDRCLADELLDLNARGITTTCSCCGHGGKRPAHIIVDEPDIPKMLELGYKMHEREYPHLRKPDGTIVPIEGPKPYFLEDYEPGDDIVLPGDVTTFEPKSQCNCEATSMTKNKKESDQSPKREALDNEH